MNLPYSFISQDVKTLYNDNLEILNESPLVFTLRTTEDIKLAPSSFVNIDSGVIFNIDEKICLELFSLDSLIALKSVVIPSIVYSSTIKSVKIALFNHSHKPLVLNKGSLIAKILIISENNVPVKLLQK